MTLWTCIRGQLKVEHWRECVIALLVSSFCLCLDLVEKQEWLSLNRVFGPIVSDRDGRETAADGRACVLESL